MTKATQTTKELVTYFDQAKRYIRHRLTLAEKKGLITPGLYQPEDVLDEALLLVYERLSSKQELKNVKVSLLQAVNQVLAGLIKKEAPLTDALSIEKIYEQELASLLEVERLTVDADGEIVFPEDIDEKEYPVKEPVAWLIEEDVLTSLIEKLDLTSPTTETARRQLALNYSLLKPQSRVLVDLVTFAELEVEEAAAVVGITPGQAKIVLAKVRERLRVD